MAVFSQEQIEAVKRSVDLVALIRSSGVELEKKGKNYRGALPVPRRQNALSRRESRQRASGTASGPAATMAILRAGTPSGGSCGLKGLSFPEAMKSLAPKRSL